MHTPNPSLFHHLLFIDIETVSEFPQLNDCPEAVKHFWLQKASTYQNELLRENPERAYQERASLHPEFGKIVCIAIGIIIYKEDQPIRLRIKTIQQDDEGEILAQFITMLDEQFSKKMLQWASYQVSEFEIPFLCRRLLINGMQVPISLYNHNHRPFDRPYINIGDLWHFGRKNMLSLDHLAFTLGILDKHRDPASGDIHHLYYEKGDEVTIRQKCIQDVFLTASIFLKIKGYPALANKQVELA